METLRKLMLLQQTPRYVEDCETNRCCCRDLQIMCQATSRCCVGSDQVKLVLELGIGKNV